jgi:hypothetical protein
MSESEAMSKGEGRDGEAEPSRQRRSWWSRLFNHLEDKLDAEAIEAGKDEPLRDFDEVVAEIVPTERRNKSPLVGTPPYRPPPSRR